MLKHLFHGSRVAHRPWDPITGQKLKHLPYQSVLEGAAGASLLHLQQGKRVRRARRREHLQMVAVLRRASHQACLCKLTRKLICRRPQAAAHNEICTACGHGLACHINSTPAP